jgi:hypothetical protein
MVRRRVRIENKFELKLCERKAAADRVSRVDVEGRGACVCNWRRTNPATASHRLHCDGISACACSINQILSMNL